VKQARNGMTVTLGGCVRLRDINGTVRLTRETSATPSFVSPLADTHHSQGVFWDHRWFLEGPLGADLTFRALGAGIKDCPDWRDSGMPRMSLMASPSVWRGDDLIAAPLAGLSGGWSARIVADFHSSVFAIED